ncbi:MAG: ABC transporter [Candidatus Handelsmanbacteria bacterium RIFCSPLOWO2_12_FULL_64_10]|uniref:ABC transporter n=1 Tax=Handelsmanbacteria sp. (strain RIFCSPLOWO2_12_FULL_64_10) TaxID=1817868 RepID=A0A1F6C2Z4_HANXR|nr:MAG: ABC transporter [Candidatus Handelsmanbacteria bacterium RIFCSPLOWO2_12_FULL_64_10]
MFGRRARRRITAVDRLSFTIPKGEIFGILGPNGSGKSTLIRMLSTLILPDAGEIEVFGRDVVADSLAVRRTINRVSVDAAFFKKLSAWENLSYAARLYGVPRGEARERTASILEEMGFSREKMEQPVEALSRGMQQKVAIARALFTSPALLLMDEPTTGLDPVSKRQVQDHTLRVRERHDTTVLLTTHDMDEAERICDRIAIIHRGRFIVEGTLADLRGHVGRDGASLEDIFIELTGKELVELDEEK